MLRPPQVTPVTGAYHADGEGEPRLPHGPVRSDVHRLAGGQRPPQHLQISPGGEWFVDTTVSIRDDGTFDAQPRWDGSIIAYERGELTHRDARIAGRFDTATSVRGTIVMKYNVDDQDVRLTCASQYMKWTATLRS